jgi:hypothetical protein
VTPAKVIRTYLVLARLSTSSASRLGTGDVVPWEPDPRFSSE